MIPNIIHYCWFGGNPLSELAQKCIASWKKYCPDCEIREWNESNFDVNCCDYVKEAYAAKKWAFVSDYARFAILYQYGGLYFDTDVELIKPIDDILRKGAFMGFETDLFKDKTGEVVGSRIGLATNPGLGLATNPGLGFYKELLDGYATRHFIENTGTLNLTTIVEYTTDLLIIHGMEQTNGIQHIADIWLYPKEYFCPLDYETGILKITDNTRSIHHYSATWKTEKEKRIHKNVQIILKNAPKYLGMRGAQELTRIYTFPHRISVKLKTLGGKKTLLFIIGKIFKNIN